MHPMLPTGEGDLPGGHSYAVVLLAASRADVLRHLRDLRFSGYLGPAEDAWVVVVPIRVVRPVAAGRRDVVTLGRELAQRLETAAVVVRVRDDRTLELAAYDGPRLVTAYESDPTYGLPPDEVEDVLPEPRGVGGAAALAGLARRPGAAAELAEILGEVLDEEAHIESERLTAVCRLLGLPPWVVAVGSLPRGPAGGPPRKAFLRLGAGRPGVAGRVGGRLLRTGRPERPRRP